ncbi:MAG TPA: histidine kinase [Chitinophagaceae bacterium]|nr:histidine kinase [Chitinophagaceae bacterium]
MSIVFTKEKIKFYLKLALAFFLLNMIGSLITEPEILLQRAVNHTWCLLFVVGLHYIFLEYTIPSIKLTLKSILRALLLILIHLLLYSLGLYGWRELGVLLHLYTPTRVFVKPCDGVGYFFAYSMASLFFFSLVRHIYNYIKLKQAEQKLRIEKQEAELNYLKSQTNPHFLFNTLNNIYSLTRDKSDLAPESILRLSKILRFMLYETSGDYIAIEQEIRIISDYIALEKLRYDESLHVNFNYDIEDMKQAIPPLLLIPLVENAFKHGVSETRQTPFVDIHLSLKQRQLNFTIINSAETAAESKNVKENIGLSNLRRQLELLYKDFSLTVQPGVSDFTADLRINLASHV